MPSRDQINEDLSDDWTSLLSIKRGKAYGTICLTFKAEDEVRRQADFVRETFVRKILPQYMGQRNTNVTLTNIPYDVVAFVEQYGRVIRVSNNEKQRAIGRGSAWTCKSL